MDHKRPKLTINDQNQSKITIIDKKYEIFFKQIIDLTIALKTNFCCTIDLTNALINLLEKNNDLTFALKKFFGRTIDLTISLTIFLEKKLNLKLP